MKKHIDPMTKKKIPVDTGSADMPGAGHAPRAQNSTSTNPGAVRQPVVKGTPMNNKRHKHVKRTARY